MTLNSKQRQFLRGLAHPLKPVVHIGHKGMGETVVEQIEAQLLAHELIKVRFNTESAVTPDEAQEEILSATGSQLVQSSGRVLTLFRQRPKKSKIDLPQAPSPQN